MTWIEQEQQESRRVGVHREENLPFLLVPDTSNDRAALLVHGFGSGPHEMRPLGNHLHQQGYLVHGIRLPGHGTSPEDLARCRAEQWAGAVQRGYQNLRRHALPISAGGLSTGALLVTQLAIERPLKSLILLSPFLELRHPLARFAGALSLFRPYTQLIINEEDQPFYYQRRSLKGVAQINRLRRRLKSQLGAVKAPALVLATAGDRTIAPDTAQQFFQRLGSPDKTFHLYGPDTPHVLIGPRSPSREDALQRCSTFLDTHGG